MLMFCWIYFINSFTYKYLRQYLLCNFDFIGLKGN